MNKRTKKQKGIKDSWLKGLPYHKDLASPVYRTRLKLDGWSEKKVRGVWDELYNVFQSWKNKHGIQEKKTSGSLDELDEILSQIEPEPWRCGGYGISDSFDLYVFLKNNEYKELKPLLEEYGDFKLLAVITLKEASIPYPSLGERNLHVLAAIKAEREMTVNYFAYLGKKAISIARPLVKEKKQKKELLDAGRALGSLSNKEKAAIRRKSLVDAAIHYFININTEGNYNDCCTWIKSQPKLKLYLTYQNNKQITDSTIKRKIAGTKEQAVKKLLNKPEA